MENNGILKSFDLQDELNSKIWIKVKGDNYVISQKVREKLLEIAYEFIEFLNVDIIVSDVHLTGSLANYNWSQYSDFDLHIIADFEQFPKNKLELYKELLTLKKTIFNSDQNIKIYGYDVELYAQDENEEHTSTGVYSLISNDWIEKPKKEKFEINKSVLKKKIDQWTEKIDKILESAEEEKDLQKSKKIIDNLKTKLKEYRKIGLEKGGEMSYENLVFKYLRRSGHIEKLFSFKKERLDKGLSLKEALLVEIEVSDISSLSKYRRAKLPKREYFMVHHTAGLGTAEGVVNVLNTPTPNRPYILGIQWVVDVDGKIYRTLPEGNLGAHVGDNSRNPKVFNSNTEGVEVVGKDDDDIKKRHDADIAKNILPRQAEAVRQLVKSLGYSPNQLVGHGEVSSNRGWSEGKTIINYIKKYWDKPGDFKLEISDLNQSQSILQPPLDKLIITSGYGDRGGTPHGAIDYGAQTGTPIKSPADGKVTSADFENNNCGGTLAIQHGDGYKTRYCHVSEFKVSVGDVVKQGQVVALTGGGEEDKGKGNSKGPHLHFELYLNGKNVNPDDYLGSTVSTPDFSRGGGNGSSKVLDELLENADKSGFLVKLKELGKSEKKLSNQSRKGSRIPYDEDVDRMQIGLQFLGHSLPVWGIDGLFGPETENAVKSFQKKTVLDESGVMTQKDLQYLYATLVKEGFEEADLSKINFKGGYDDNILDVSPDAVSADFETMTKIIVDNIEGGYYNPEWHRQSAMGDSGETMFGMDRFNGSDLFKSVAGRKFWETIDKNKNKDVWKHYYMGGSLEPELLRLVTEIMTKHYQTLSDKYLSDKSKKLVQSNNGLKLHFYYASWNGSNFFQKFAEKINDAVDDGIESPEKLLSIAINSRLNMPIMKKSGDKLLKIFKSNNIA